MNLKKVFENKKLLIGLITLAVMATGFYFWSVRNGRFVKGPSMNYSRAGHTATLLKDGKVLIAGGAIFDNNPIFTDEAEIYNPKTKTINAVVKMNISRHEHTATLLKNGNVLIVGGVNRFRPIANAEIYDTKNGKFNLIGTLNVPRSRHTATLLQDGNVLITGGSGGNHYLFSCEIFDVKTNQFKLIKGMMAPRYYHTATLLNNGQVLIAGGANESGILSSAELFNPKLNQFKPTTSMTTSRWQNTATLLQNGNVLFLGGENSNNNILSSAEIYDANLNKFLNIAEMKHPRAYHTATLLNDGSVLVAGGIKPLTWGGEILSTALLYNPKKNQFTKICSMKKNRKGHKSTLLNNGDVFITGGRNAYNSVEQKQSELFIK